MVERPDAEDIESGQTRAQFGRAAGVMFGGAVCMLAGTYIAIQLYKSFGIFGSLKDTGIYDSAFVAGGGLAVFWPFAVIRTRSWPQWLGLFLATVPVAAWCSAAGTLAGLARMHLSWQSAHAVMLVVFLLLVAPVIVLHIRLFDRFGMVPRISSEKDDLITPADARNGVIVHLPGVLTVLLLADLLSVTGATDALPAIPWELLVIVAFMGTFATAGAAPRTLRQRLLLSAIVVGLMTVTALLAVAGAALAAAVVSERLVVISMFATGMLALSLAKRVIKPVKRWAGPYGLWRAEDSAGEAVEV